MSVAKRSSSRNPPCSAFASNPSSRTFPQTAPPAPRTTSNRSGSKRKRPSASTSTSTSSQSSSTSASSSSLPSPQPPPPKLMTQEQDDSEFSDFTCPICLETMSEPTIILCGHTFCRSCILKTMEINASRCPKCGAGFTTEKLCPNFVLADLITRRSRTKLAAKADIFESSGAFERAFEEAPPTTLVKLVNSANYQELNLFEVDRLLKVLQRRKETMTSEEEEFKRKLLQEFLGKLLKVKNERLENLTQEISWISEDISAVSDGDVNYDFGSGSASEICTMESNSFLGTLSTGKGFNTQPLVQLEHEQQSYTARKRRMYSYFEELSNVYLDNRRRRSYQLPQDNQFWRNHDDATVPSGEGDDDEEGTGGDLGTFGRTLSHVTRYHSLKPLATLSHNEDTTAATSGSNIVSSIEFDTDNELFAIAGVTKQIKLFEYMNVIGSTADLHSPTTTLTCNVKISCLGWSSHYKNNLASSDYDGGVTLWDVRNSTRIRNFFEHERRVWSIDWSEGNPHILASGSDDSKVKIWSTNMERSVVNLEAKVNICSVKFCPESAYQIVFGCADHCVHYYDLRNAKVPLAMLYGHKKAVSYVKFVGKHELVSASTDSHLKMWNLKSGDPSSMNCVRTFSGHANEKNFVGLATEGNYIACGSENNSLYVYYKLLPTPLFSFKFQNHQSLFAPLKVDETPEFVSAVAWKKGSPVVIAANSNGIIKVLQLV